MSAIDVRDLLKLAEPAGPRADALTGEPALSAVPPAEALAPMRPAAVLSPVVLTGCVRALEFASIVVLGITVHQMQLHGLVPLNLASRSWSKSPTITRGSG